MGPCSSKADMQAQNQAPRNEMQPEQNVTVKKTQNMFELFPVAEPDLAPAENRKKKSLVGTILGKLGKKKRINQNGEEQQYSEQIEDRFNPDKVICEPRKISRALKENSEAMKFPTDQPNIQLVSPMIEGVF